MLMSQYLTFKENRKKKKSRKIAVKKNSGIRKLQQRTKILKRRKRSPRSSKLLEKTKLK